MVTTATFVIGAGATPATYYVAIGASQALGYQPAGPGVQRPTDQGYTNDLLAMERARWPGLRLVTFACPGVRVDMALAGRTRNMPSSIAAETVSGRCRRQSGSEVRSASDFIRAHPGQVTLVTVDLGFPDVTACIRHRVIDAACVTSALHRVHVALAKVVARLRAAGPSPLRIVGLDHDDPFLGYDVGVPDSDASFAKASLAVVERFNRLLGTAYERMDVPVAHVSSAFGTGVTTPTRDRAWGTLPADVKRICRLTWVCTDRNPHPNARGYRRIASAVVATLKSHAP